MIATILAVMALTVWLYLLLLHGGFWLAREREENFISPRLTTAAHWPRVAAIIPARNEADMIPQTLSSLLALDYPGEFSVILIDDQSNDGTSDVAKKIAACRQDKLEIVSGAPLPVGWTGKVWAMHQGVTRAAARPSPPVYLLLTDADISYDPDVLKDLVARAVGERRVLISVMAKLNCESHAERALVPAFVFFFQMLYPFAWVNRASTSTAAAAGGCMLVDRAALERAGGMAAISGALIDDCGLAKVMKSQGSVWLGLSQRVNSQRRYPLFDDIRGMVARSAYAQLRYSPLLLVGTALGMGLVYLAPPLLTLFAGYPANLIAAVAYMMMVIAMQPILRLYDRSPLWGFALPLIAAAYLGFTFDSAYQHWAGRGGLWKGRVQAGAGKT